MSDMWTCPACEAPFELLSGLTQHIRAEHPDDDDTRGRVRPLVFLDALVSREPGRLPPPEEVVEASEHFRPFDGFDEAAQAVVATLGARRGGAEEVLLRLLGTLRQVEEDVHEAEDAPTDEPTGVDPETSLADRRGWLDVLATEEDRSARHGLSVAVIALRLADLPPAQTLRAVAGAVMSCVRAHDTVARLDERTIAVLAPHCTALDADVLAERISEAVAGIGMPAVVGVGAREPRRDLHRAWEEAILRIELNAVHG